MDDVVADHLSLSDFGHGSGLEINTTSWLKSHADSSNLLEELDHETLSVSLNVACTTQNACLSLLLDMSLEHIFTMLCR